MDNQIWTRGVDHVGLTVRDLGATRDFFCGALGWQVVGERPEYPASSVSDGTIRVTLWRAVRPEEANAFDRKNTIGLHHLAFRVNSLDHLHALHQRLKAWPGVTIEFAPEQAGPGPRIHMMLAEPSGNRIEFVHDPRVALSGAPSNVKGV